MCFRKFCADTLFIYHKKYNRKLRPPYVLVILIIFNKSIEWTSATLTRSENKPNSGISS